MASVAQHFQRRADRIPELGIGLSVDVYSPDVFDLMNEMKRRGLQPDYLEIFKAPTAVLETVRRAFPNVPLTYHGEGLWVTQPDFPEDFFLDRTLMETVHQLESLHSCWLNLECATKQMAGYAFGTYLPPLYTFTSAHVVADNVKLVQRALDRSCGDASEGGPLLLLEMSPLTYFVAGTIPVPEFFELVTSRAACGLVLDIGHLWTVYRYTAVRHGLPLNRFLRDFLSGFPMERVIEIHVAGLAEHETARDRPQKETPPAWIDAHAAPIPSLLFAMLEQVLTDPRLVNLRGIALEVDTKPIPLIVQEFDQVSGKWEGHTVRTKAAFPLPQRLPRDREPCMKDDREQLRKDYVQYAKIVSGQMRATGLEWQASVEDDTGLERYIKHYLPHEILHWGGELADMFPDTCRMLAREGIELKTFVAWWFHTARTVDAPYDFFLLKVDRMIDFVTDCVPALKTAVEREGALLRAAYAEANNGLQRVMEPFQ